MKNNKKAFTLIELLVVVLIIGILSAVALPQYTFAVEKARFAKVQQTVGTLQKAIDIWFLENGESSSDGIVFLGKNANAQLSVDINMDCSSSDDACKSKYFSYYANALSSSCMMVVHQLNGAYTITWIRDSTGWHGDECDYYPENSPIGEKICKMLEKQGNGFFACENC
ncbi:MAG: prepilin-type N-terminal cleavage/methylation domain-containing protein [Elusimicrobiaceae bacterium]|nr:prepilin-type N-terminal cleavage/methylation domain-containing protein [Elusimicrobiaceae bacterium]